MKKITEKMKTSIEKEIKILLHASRDALRSRYRVNKSNHNPLCVRFSANCGYYSEAHGIMHCLQVLGYGKLASINLDGIQEGFDQKEQNLSWWFYKLSDEVLKEEGFDSDHRCGHCLKRYGEDDKSLIEKGVL